MGAKEVLARLQEDDSRKSDAALNTLVNKMLQDPYDPIKLVAMAALESRSASGDALTFKLLQSVQNQKVGTGSEASLQKEDALTASNILLKMAGNKVEKEFDVKNNPKAEN